jgi:hypothetical protein
MTRPFHMNCKLRRVAMRRDEMERRKRWRNHDWEEFGFGVLIFIVFVICPTMFVLGATGVL